MKTKLTLFLLFGLFAVTLQAQDVDEIINNYFENTGGLDKWHAIKGIEMHAKVNQQGMEIPITIIQMADGKQLMKFELQGKELVQMAFDGEVAWGHNFMNMQPEKKDNETTENLKRSKGDFPDPFLDYKDKGYKAELLGKEAIEGTECFKIKLTKTPKLVDGEEKDDIAFYYFDAENFVPLVVEQEIQSGQFKGQISRSTFSDYQEVDGMYFPFSISEGIKDMGSQAIVIDSIVLNPQVDENVFKFPDTNAASEESEGNK